MEQIKLSKWLSKIDAPRQKFYSIRVDLIKQKKFEKVSPKFEFWECGKLVVRQCLKDSLPEFNFGALSSYQESSSCDPQGIWLKSW